MIVVIRVKHVNSITQIITKTQPLKWLYTKENKDQYLQSCKYFEINE